MGAASLRDFLADMRAVEVVPLPPSEEWSATTARIHIEGRVSEISVDTYDWYLECLPPKWMGSGFAFAEGAEAIKLFWKRQERYFVRQLTWSETQTFCRLAGIPLPW